MAINPFVFIQYNLYSIIFLLLIFYQPKFYPQLNKINGEPKTVHSHVDTDTTVMLSVLLSSDHSGPEPDSGQVRWVRLQQPARQHRYHNDRGLFRPGLPRQQGLMAPSQTSSWSLRPFCLSHCSSLSFTVRIYFPYPLIFLFFTFFWVVYWNTHILVNWKIGFLWYLCDPFCLYLWSILFISSWLIWLSASDLNNFQVHFRFNYKMATTVWFQPTILDCLIAVVFKNCSFGWKFYFYLE